MGEVSFRGKPLEQYTDEVLGCELTTVLQRPARRPRAATLALWVGVLRAFDANGMPQTVRQLFYALETRGIVPKSQAGYRRVQTQVVQMRRRGLLPYEWIADNTRWMRKPQTYTGLRAWAQASKECYRRGLWANQGSYVEVWIEKDALAGVIYDITSAWDVPLMVTRGFPSDTFLYSAAEALKAQTKPVYLYYFGDSDKSGRNITKTTERKLRGFGADFHFELAAVTDSQIRDWGLPTRPEKHGPGRCVELDAIPAKMLKQLCQDVIERHIDTSALKAVQEAEALELQTVERVMAQFGASTK